MAMGLMNPRVLPSGSDEKGADIPAEKVGEKRETDGDGVAKADVRGARSKDLPGEVRYPIAACSSIPNRRGSAHIALQKPHEPTHGSKVSAIVNGRQR